MLQHPLALLRQPFSARAKRSRARDVVATGHRKGEVNYSKELTEPARILGRHPESANASPLGPRSRSAGHSAMVKETGREILGFDAAQNADPIRARGLVDCQAIQITLAQRNATKPLGLHSNKSYHEKNPTSTASDTLPNP